jgi:hypothetical protein
MTQLLYFNDSENYLLKYLSNYTAKIIKISTFSFTEPPSIWVSVFLIERIELLVPFLSNIAHLICELEEIRSNINQPFWIYRTDIPHVLLCCENELVINNPFRLFVEERTTGMDVDLVIIHQCSIAPFWIFLSSMEEKSRNNCFPNQRTVASTACQMKFIPFQEF